MTYGSELERIASESAGASSYRTNQLSGLISQFLAARNAASFSGPSMRRMATPKRGSVKNGPPISMHAGVHGPIRPNAKIVTIRDGQGHSVQVNASVADEFKSFLRALKKTGYDINSIGGYANRNIAGTSTKSLHSYGLAIDINPSDNPVTYGRRQTDLPRGIGRLAKKYGIAWGGNWRGSKKDTMHFSFPFFGTK